VTAKPVPKTVASSPLPQYSGGITVSGLVDNPLNLTDADLLSLPMVSEIATIQCVYYDVPGSPATITVNWTGIPLFYILTMAQVRPEAFKVVFHARPPDSFFDTLTINETLDPRIILAVKANGTLLTTVSEIYPDHIGGYRLVVPGRWGYKWVANVGSIEVVDQNVLGTYETELHESDEALIPVDQRAQGYALPASIKPPLEVFPPDIWEPDFPIRSLH
jgi:DMSO/TMAO reductase YedYZ molybdopterin-dependent catalytic subunit